MTAPDAGVLHLSPRRYARGVVTLPGSKSISNRVLLLSALARGVTRVEGLLASDDTRVMLDSLARLGVACEPADDAMRIVGCDGRFASTHAELFIGNSGLTIRTLVPAIAASLANSGEGSVTLAGVPRMHERPIGDLVDGLRQLGARIEYIGAAGFPPLRIDAAPLAAPAITVRGDTSSQFLTGLLQAAPLIAREHPLVINVQGELISKPYVEITLALMAQFGVHVQREGWARFVIAPGQAYVSPVHIQVEGDASSASYFLAAGAIGDGPVRVAGAGRASLQGDVRFADALALMGARVTWADDWIETQAAPSGLRGIDLDCNHIPDAAMTLAVCALHAEGATTLRNIGSWRVKETDRIAAMATELRRFGARVEEGEDWLRIHPPAALQAATVDTYDDHRMAMSLSLASLGERGVPVTVRDPGCVGKTFPTYFQVLDNVSHAANAATSEGMS